uniref:RING-type domain-containing protein n=1 Tax=Caenorhabditis tropicalis TaxID=1561998 RepID=A0A1I7UQS1_9PELO
MSSNEEKQNRSEARNETKLVDVLSRHVECCICMAVLHNAASCTPCLHTFCIGCIVKWTEKNKGKCPMCRVSVKEISPNWVMRDLVDNYLEIRPNLKRLKNEQDELDKSELEYTLKWLGEADSKLLYIESLSSLRGAPESGDIRTTAMMTRAMELFKHFLDTESNPLPKDVLQRGLAKLVEDVKKETFPASLFIKYHRLERSYKSMVRLSIPIIGPNEHTWLGNFYYDTARAELAEDVYDDEDETDEDSEDDDDFDLDLPTRIANALIEMRHPERRKPPRPLIGGFDPVDLGALSRVQNMRAPGFIRSSAPDVPRETTTRLSRQPPLRRPPSRYRRDSNMQAIPEQAPMLTRRHARRSEATTSSDNGSSPPRPPRRSARLASRTPDPEP